MIFFTSQLIKRKLKLFMEDFKNLMPNFKFICEPDKDNISFLDLNITLSKDQLLSKLHMKPTACHQ